MTGRLRHRPYNSVQIPDNPGHLNPAAVSRLGGRPKPAPIRTSAADPRRLLIRTGLKLRTDAAKRSTQHHSNNHKSSNHKSKDRRQP